MKAIGMMIDKIFYPEYTVFFAAVLFCASKTRSMFCVDSSYGMWKFIYLYLIHTFFTGYLTALNRKRMLQLVRSQSQWRPISATWSLSLRWLEALLVSTMARPSTRLRSSLRWLATILQSSPSPTSQSSTVGPVSVPPTRRGLSLWNELLPRSVVSQGFSGIVLSAFLLVLNKLHTQDILFCSSPRIQS